MPGIPFHHIQMDSMERELVEQAMKEEAFANVHLPSGIELLEHRVQQKLNGRVAALRLSHEHQGVVIHGFADTYYAKQLAQHVVMEESDLPILANEIEVH